MVSLDFLRKVPIFANVKPDHLEILKSKLRSRRYQRGEVVFHQDDPGDRLHIVIEGVVKISIISEDGREKDLVLFRPGECFGEMALVDDSPRSATATAVEDSETLVLLREDFLLFFREHPEVAEDITTLLARRLRHVNEMLGDMVFLDVPTRVAKQLLELAEVYGSEPKQKDPIVVPLGQPRDRQPHPQQLPAPGYSDHRPSPYHHHRHESPGAHGLLFLAGSGLKPPSGHGRNQAHCCGGAGDGNRTHVTSLEG